MVDQQDLPDSVLEAQNQGHIPLKSSNLPLPTVSPNHFRVTFSFLPSTIEVSTVHT